MAPMPDDEDEDMAALSGLMAEDAPEAPPADTEQGTASPETLVSELKTKIAELEAALRGM